MTDLLVVWQPAAWLRKWTVGSWQLISCGAILLALLYRASYLAYPDLPGQVPEFPLGWWGWFDQSKTLDSSRALALGDFDPIHHWYPLGYSVLGALFWRLDHAHAFFLLDLILLLVAYLGFVAFARRVGVPTPWCIGLFLISTAGDHRLFAQWVIPWNTTAPAAFIWLLLAVTAAHMDGVRRPFLIGLLAASIPLFRPTEAVLVAPCVAAALIADVRYRRLQWKDVWRASAGVVLPVTLYAVLYLRIYGPHPTEYMLSSRQIGFTLYDLGWKAYVILIEPRGWFMDGEGLLRRAPWIALGIAGLVPAVLGGRGLALLALLLVVHAVLYLSYVDLLPTGFWRFNSVHYWTWALPGYGLLALLLVRDLVLPRTRRQWAIGGLALIATLLMLCIHLEPKPAAATEPAKMVEFPGITTEFGAAYFGQWALRDRSGELGNVIFVRGVPTPSGLRVLALRRPLVGAMRWAADPPEWQSTAPPLRWRIGFSIGRPCWLAFLHCKRPPTSSLLPPPPA